MRHADVQIGQVVDIRISGRVQACKIMSIDERPSQAPVKFRCLNLKTGRELKVSARRMRGIHGREYCKDFDCLKQAPEGFDGPLYWCPEHRRS